MGRIAASLGLTLAAALMLAATADARTWRIRPGDGEAALQRAFIEAGPGDSIEIGRGRLELTGGLTLAADRVRVRGEGADRTILSFTNQQRGEAGLTVTASGAELAEFAVENARGGAVAARDCQGIAIVGVRAEWTGGAQPGRFGLGAINCSDVLIRGAVARGASGAGVFISNCRNIILRDTASEGNLTGIAIENSANADVFANTASQNAAGVLVLSLPGGGEARAVRVFANRINANNAANSASHGADIAPAGTGVLIAAARDVHVFDNEIGDNGAANIIVSAYRGAFQDAAFNPLPHNVMIRDNRFGNTGFAPQGDLALIAAMGQGMPDVLWDGATMYSANGAPRLEQVALVVRDNRSSRTRIGSFLSLGLPVAGSPYSEAAPDPTFPPLLQLAEPPPVRIRN